MGVLLAFLCALPVQEYKDMEEYFTLRAEVENKFFLTKDQRSVILDDYTGDSDHSWNELGIDLHIGLPCKIEMDAYPYFRVSDERGLSHIGLKGEFRYPLWCYENLKLGYSHYSYHNADEDTPNNKGRTMDSFFLRWDFWGPVYVRPQYYFNTSEPIEIKDVYRARHDPEAVYEFRVGAQKRWEMIEFDLHAKFQMTKDTDLKRYGVGGNLLVDLWGPISFISDFEFRTIESESELIITAGFAIRLR